MDRSERCYSVLLVSASQKFTQDVLPLLPERSFSPVVKAADVSSARRCLLERSFDLLIINTPLPDDVTQVADYFRLMKHRIGQLAEARR